MKTITIDESLAGEAQSVTRPLGIQRFTSICGTLFILMTASLGSQQAAQAAVMESWVHRYNNVVSNANDQAFRLVRGAAGEIIVTGTTDNNTSGLDMLTIKYSGLDGSVIWQQRYNSPANRDDVVTAVAVDRVGNVVVAGYSTNPRELDETGYSYSGVASYTAKYSAADGSLIWEKREQHTANPYNYLTTVAVDSVGNVVVTGVNHEIHELHEKNLRWER